MSFASNVKSELLSLKIEDACCNFAETYGILLFGHSFTRREISLQTENRKIAEYYCFLVEKLTGIKPCLTPCSSNKQCAEIVNPKDCLSIMKIFGHTGKELSLRINQENIQNECCISAFIRGAFLACGTITSPKKDYHLEFSIPYRKLSGDFFAFLEELNFKPKLSFYTNPTGWM